MTYRTLLILSAVFGCIPLAGELFLLYSSGKFNPTVLAAIGIAALLSVNVLAYKFHHQLVWSQLVFCLILTLGVATAIANDGGIESPLWFFQILLVFGAGFVFGKKGVLIQGACTIAIALAYYFISDLSGDNQGITDFTSILASTLVFTTLSYLYELEKEKKAVATANLLVANEELRQFAYRTSHDLKSPLTAIKSLAGLIREDIDSGDLDEAKEIASRIINRAESLERLIVDILDLAKADLIDEAAEAIDLSSIIDQITDRLSTEGGDNAVKIIVELTHTGLINLPRTRVLQVLENLISNAIRYRDPNAPEPFVKISSADTTTGVEIAVSDNGRGISDQHSDQIFQMFKRFHPDIKIGSGLGLYIVKKHIDRLGSNITYNRTENGSVFTLLLKRGERT